VIEAAGADLILSREMPICTINFAASLTYATYHAGAFQLPVTFESSIRKQFGKNANVGIKL